MESFNIVMRKDCLRMKRIGMLTSGGDCQALNAAMRGVVKGLSNNVDELEIYGFHNGYKGLIYGDYRLLTSADFSGILTKGGTILGSSRQPFKQMRVPDENGLDKVEAMKQTYHKLNLDCLVILGGNGTQKTANLLREEGLNVVQRQSIMKFMEPMLPLVSRARSTLRQRQSTAFIRQQLLTTVYLSWKLWDTKSAG